MKLYDAASFALSCIKAAAVRTFLTLLGLSVGVAAVLTVLSLSETGETRVEEEISNLGVNKVWIRPKDSAHALLLQDRDILLQTTGAPACAASYKICDFRQGNHAGVTQVAGFDQGMNLVHAPKLLSGRSFRASEYEQGSLVCLVDEMLMDRLEDAALGSWLTIQHRRMRIVGVIETLAAHAVSAGSGMIILPLRTYTETFGETISEVVLSVPADQSTETVAALALESITPKGGYRVETLEEEIVSAREIVRIFVRVLLCVAVVCMLTGGIGVTNVLLMSIRERQTEIGLMKAIGGTNLQMGLLFLMEAVIYAVCGNLAGIILAAGMIRLFGWLIDIPAMLRADQTIIVFMASAALGLVAGVTPAVKAARMLPVDALRCE